MEIKFYHRGKFVYHGVKLCRRYAAGDGVGEGVLTRGLLAPIGRLPRAMTVGAATRLWAPTARGCFSLDKSRGRGQKWGRRSESLERPEGRRIVAGLDVSEEVGETGGIHFLDFGFEAGLTVVDHAVTLVGEQADGAC